MKGYTLCLKDKKTLYSSGFTKQNLLKFQFDVGKMCVRSKRQEIQCVSTLLLHVKNITDSLNKTF